MTREAREDLQRLEDFLVEMALEHGDLDLPGRAVDAIRNEMRILETNPYTCRMAHSNPLEGELIIPFGGSGYVALFEIISDDEVAVQRCATSARMTITSRPARGIASARWRFALPTPAGYRPDDPQPELVIGGIDIRPPGRQDARKLSVVGTG